MKFIVNMQYFLFSFYIFVVTIKMETNEQHGASLLIDLKKIMDEIVKYF
jgi:hypothetical protein